MKPKCSVYIASSLDGFIARKDGGIDWLEFDSPDERGKDDSGAESSSADASGADASDAEDYGFAEFIETVDLLLMGRHTYETLLTFDEWVYGDTELMVLSSTLGPEAIPARHEGKVSIASGTPHEILADLTDSDHVVGFSESAEARRALGPFFLRPVVQRTLEMVGGKPAQRGAAARAPD